MEQDYAINKLLLDILSVVTEVSAYETEFGLPYNPAYGLDNRTRVEVLRSVIHWKLTVKDAARIYNLSPSTIYRWVADAKKPNINTNTQGAK